MGTAIMSTRYNYLKKIIRIIPVIILVELATIFCQPKTEEPPFFNIAFSEKIFVNINQNDATALTKVLTENLLENSPIKFKTGAPNIYSSIEELEESVKKEKNDLYVLLPEEFLHLEKLGLLEPIAVSSRNNSVYDVYKLIVSKESKIKDLKDLKGKKIQIGFSADGDNPHTWLDYLLYSKGLGKKEKYFEAIEVSDKSLPVLLKLYFGQADACIVSEDNLNLAAEMNPQLATSFITLEVSKPILRSVLADRKSKSDENKKLLLDNLLNLDKSSEGKQILTLFRIDKLLPFKKEYLQNSYEIIKRKK